MWKVREQGRQGGGVQLTAAPQPQICLKGKKEEIKLEKREKKSKKFSFITKVWKSKTNQKQGFNAPHP